VSAFPEDRDMLTKWRHFAKVTLKNSIEFTDVVDVLVKFIGPAFDAIVHESEFFGHWNPERLCYKPYK